MQRAVLLLCWLPLLNHCHAVNPGKYRSTYFENGEDGRARIVEIANRYLFLPQPLTACGTSRILAKGQDFIIPRIGESSPRSDATAGRITVNARTDIAYVALRIRYRANVSRIYVAHRA